MQKKKLYGTATVGTKGQVVIPADAREELGIQPGDRLYVIGVPHGNALVLLQEEQLQEFIEKMNVSVDTLKEFKAKHSNK